MFEWLIENGNSLKINKSENLEINFELMLEDITKLVEEIKTIEKIDDDEVYKKSSKALVMKYLPSGKEGNRFSTPTRYRMLSERVVLPAGNIDFKSMSF